MPTPPVILLCAAGVGLAALLFYYFTTQGEREPSGYHHGARPPRRRENRYDLEQCSICQDVIINTVSMKTLTCGHTFHYRCIDKWFEAVPSAMNCPNCRQNAL